MPRLRVVIPTYNRSSLLAEALASVQEQSFGDFEVVVADDASTDDTESVVATLAAADPRIHYLKVRHGGVAAARNAAIGVPDVPEFIALLDSDDLWQPEHLARAVSLLDRERGISIVFGAFETQDLTGTWTADRLEARNDRVRRPLSCVERIATGGDGHVLRTDRVHAALLRGEFSPHPSTTVVRAAAVRVSPWFDRTYQILEDCLFFLRLAHDELVYGFDDYAHCRVRYQGDNLTGASDLSSPITLKRQTDVLRYCQALRQYCTNAADRRMVAGRIADQSYLVGQCRAEQLDLAGARRAYLASLRRPSIGRVKGVLSTLVPRQLLVRPRSSPPKTGA